MDINHALDYVNKLVNKDGQYGDSWGENKYRAHRIDDTTAFAYNSDFLVIAHKERIYVAIEDDGSFHYSKEEPFSINAAFTYALVQLLVEIQNYITLRGIPYHFAPEKTTRCGFALGVNIDDED